MFYLCDLPLKRKIRVIKLLELGANVKNYLSVASCQFNKHLLYVRNMSGSN